MGSSRTIANVLFYISKILSIVLLFIGLYSAIILCLSFYSKAAGLPILISNNHFIIYYPFTKIPFLAGDYTKEYMLISSGIIFLYGCFLWLLAGVFNAYRQKKLFVKKNVDRLRAFYVFNFIVPLVVFFYLVVANQLMHDVLVITFLHLMLAVFIYFMAEIFTQGLLLQEEQDLTL